MNSLRVNTNIIKAYLETLANRTRPDWRHLFVTTNWDYLLQREILALNLIELPAWMVNNHVFHVNGTAEVLRDNTNRSPFLLEGDRIERRHFTPEANIAYNNMIWQRTFVVVGMSFECAADRFLLSALNRVEDDLPIGESTWFLINRNQWALNKLVERISAALPAATMIPIRTTFESWLRAGLPELRIQGVFAN